MFLAEMQSMAEIWKDLILFGIALVGAVLGILNFVRDYIKDRMKLRVRLNHGIAVNLPTLPDVVVGVEVINLSQFAVTIAEVGVETSTGNRLAFVGQISPGEGAVPRRLEPRESVIVYANPCALPYEQGLVCAYARTACGERVRYKQRDLNTIVREAAEQAI